MHQNAGLTDLEHLRVPRLTLAHLGVWGVPCNSDGKLLSLDQNPDWSCLFLTESMPEIFRQMELLQISTDEIEQLYQTYRAKK